MTKCISCQEYYGMEINNNQCSKCCINPTKPPIFSNNTDMINPQEIASYIYKIGYVPLSDKCFNVIFRCMNSRYKTIFTLDSLHQILNLFREEDSKKYMFTDLQCKKLIDGINMVDINYQISHFIVKNRLYPWRIDANIEFHKSSYCYYGNFGEIPKYKRTIEQILKNNMTNRIMY